MAAGTGPGRGEARGLQNQSAGVQIPAPPLARGVTWGKGPLCASLPLPCPAHNRGPINTP